MNIYVGNISWGLTDQDLENVFAEHGTVTSAKIITDRATGVKIHDGLNSVLEFETYIDDISVNGVDLIEWNEEGKICNFKVMIRPFKAVQKVQEKMIEALESIT